MSMQGQGAFAKLTIEPMAPSDLAKGGPIEAMFNPNSYSLLKTTNWGTLLPQKTEGETQTDRKLNAPLRDYGGGSSRTLTLQLFFDVTESEITDVRQETMKIAALTMIERNQGRPPVCKVSWGSAPEGSDFPFVGVVTSLTQNFTLFRKTGEPVRADLTVIFTEFIDAEADERKTDPDFTTYRVKRGDTLSSIAARMYRDPTRWRLIAEANSLDDPRRIEVGRVLAIPQSN